VADAEGEAAAEPPTRSSVQSTRNFEVDRAMTYVKESANTVSRLSVAVLVDDISDMDEEGNAITRPLDPAELAELQSLVRGAIGFNEERGDTVSITNVGFYEGPAAAEPEAPGFMSQPLVKDILRQLPAAALLLVVVLGVIRPIVMALGKGGSPIAGGAAGGGKALPAGAAGVASAGGGAGMADAAPLTFDDKVSVAKQLAANDPERVAQVVRAWVQEGKG